jgi:gluconokinase
MDIGSAPAVVVMGVSGSGKSTVGKLLADRLGVAFGDADDFHTPELKAKMAAGHPLTDSDRWPWLARLADWLRTEQDGAVLACSALRRSYRDVLRTGSSRLCFLHLDGSAEVVGQRVGHRLNHYMPASLVASQYATLEPLGPEESGMAIDFTLGPEQIVERFLNEVVRDRGGDQRLPAP